MLQHLLERNKLICSSYLLCLCVCVCVWCVLFLFWIVFVFGVCCFCSELFKIFPNKVCQTHMYSVLTNFHYLTNERSNSIEQNVCREGSSSAATMCIIAFLESRALITLFTKSHNLSLFWARWNHSTVSRHMVRGYCNINILITSICYKFSSGDFLLRPMRATFPALPSFLSLMSLVIFWE